MTTFLIFLSAAIFRITNLNLIEFKTDEAINLLLASRPVFGYPFPHGGTISSLGILNPPFFNYLLYPIALFTQDPKIVTFLIGLVNATAVVLLFLVVKRYYGLTIGLIFGLLLSFSPWAILYSRKIWMQDLILPFFVPIFYSIHKLIQEKKTIYWLPYTIFSLFLIQLHQVNIVFLTILTISLILLKVRLSWKYIGLGVLIGILPLIPYFLYEWKNSCPDCQSLITARDKLNNIRSFELFQRPFQIMSQGNFRFVLGNDTLTLSEKFPLVELGRKLFYFEYILLPFGIFIFIKKFKSLKFLAFSVILLPFTYFILKFEPFMHYFIIATPLLFLFLAVAFSNLIRNKNLSIKFGSRFLLVLIITISIAFNYSFFELLRFKGGLQGDYGSVYQGVENKKKNDLLQFENQPDYEEIFLSSFIPLDYVYGYQPLGKILYPNISEEEVLSLESKLQEESKDPRIKQKIINFYTKKGVNLKTIDLLREKTSNMPQYEPLYTQVLGDYLSQNFKKEYLWLEGGFRFFYPEHWKVEKENMNLKILGDGYVLTIRNLIGKEITCKKVANSCNKETIEEIINSIRPYNASNK